MFLGRIHCLRPCLPLHLTTPLVSFKTTIHVSLPNHHFPVVDYLIQSCGLSSDQALKASKRIRHLETPDKPDAVLQFLRQIGISESDIKTAVARNALLLCSTVDRNWRPNIAKLVAVGLTIKDVSGFIARCPKVFLFNFSPKIDFWLSVLGSVGNLKLVLRRCGSILDCNLESVAVPNLSFLQYQCGLSAPQIVRLVKMDPRLITSSTETMKMKAKRAEELGIARSSAMFVNALIVVDQLSRCTLEARLNNLESLGLSQEEVTTLVSKHPFALKLSEEMIGRKIEFLIKEAGCDNLDLVQHPVLLTYNLDNRIIPRNVVRKLLVSKGCPLANNKFVSFLIPTEKWFVEKYVLPYEGSIPGLHQAYADASAGKTGRID